MTANDSLHRFIFDKAPVRGEFIHLHESYKTIVNQHAYPEPIKKLLGEALCVAGLLSAIIKFNGRLSVQFRGKGKLKMLLAQCDNKFQLRGIAKWDGEISYTDLMDSFNDGVLVITLDSGPNQNRYQGIVAWRGNSLAESIEGYFKESEQLATKIWLAVNESSAAGLLLQVVPATDKNLSGIEEEVILPHWAHIAKLATHLEPAALLSEDYQTLLRTLYPEEEIRIFEPIDVSFHCSCTRQRGEDAIKILGQKEAEEELRDKQSIVVTCDFCNKEYIFDRIDVAKIFETKDGPASDQHLH